MTFLFGLWLGAAGGWLLCAVCTMAKRADDE